MEIVVLSITFIESFLSGFLGIIFRKFVDNTGISSILKPKTE